jgi:hypothetical protein
MNDERHTRNAWQRLSSNEGPNSSLAIVALGAAFLALVVLMIARSGHNDARPPEPVKPGITRNG